MNRSSPRIQGETSSRPSIDSRRRSPPRRAPVATWVVVAIAAGLGGLVEDLLDGLVDLVEDLVWCRLADPDRVEPLLHRVGGLAAAVVGRAVERQRLLPDLRPDLHPEVLLLDLGVAVDVR